MARLLEGEEIKCPHCGADDAYETGKEGAYRCRHCKKNFEKRTKDPLMDESAVERIVNEYYNDETEESSPTCPACSGQGVPFGSLGSRMHYRCRQCGYDFSEDTTPASTPPKAYGMMRPKANIMPGGSMGPVGDTTAIGISGGGN